MTSHSTTDTGRDDPFMGSQPGEWATLVAQIPACNAGSIPGLGRSPGGGRGNSLQYSCLENLHGQRSLVGYSPGGCKELDSTERLSTSTNTRKHTHFQAASVYNSY